MPACRRRIGRRPIDVFLRDDGLVMVASTNRISTSLPKSLRLPGTGRAGRNLPFEEPGWFGAAGDVLRQMASGQQSEGGRDPSARSGAQADALVGWRTS